MRFGFISPIFNSMAREIDKAGDRDVAAFLDQVAALKTVRAEGAGGRLIFALDATASRQPTWDEARALQGEMFAEAARAGSLSVQLVYFRGNDECKASPWVADAARMVGYMSAIACVGGFTQIARVLRHARDQNAEAKVAALVFVGDAVEESPDELARLAGELGLAGLPAFMFQEGDDPAAAQAFRAIAKLSGGAYHRFDRSAIAQLRTLLGAVAAYAAGGRGALIDYDRRQGGTVAGLLAQLR